MYYGAHAAPTHASALYKLMLAMAKRIHAQPPPEGCSQVRFPVGLLFVRGDRAGDGKKLAEQAVASFDYWDKDSADSFDIVMAGWTKNDSGIHFELDEFLAFRKVIEKSSTWEYSGETDLLLLNFEINLSEVYGWFDYSEVIVLPVETMLRDKHIGSIDGFITELVSSSKKVSESARHSGNSPIWEISDSTGILKAKEDLWQALKRFVLGDYADMLNAMENFAVRDIQKDSSPILRLPFERMRAVRCLIEGAA